MDQAPAQPRPDVVPPVAGAPPPPPPVQAPPARRPARLRHASAPVREQRDFPDAQGVPSVLKFAENYTVVPNYRLGNSTFVASTLAMFAWINQADTRMAQNDRFLKSNPLWHPLITQLYCSFLFFLHVLRVAEVSGSLTPHESTILSILKEKFPLSYLPVPGYLVHIFSAVTVTMSPYDWLGQITPALPSLAGWSQTNLYMLQSGLANIIPNVWLIIDQIHCLASSPLVPENSNFDFFHNIFGTNISNATPVKNLLNCPNARFPLSLSGRVDRSFQIFVSRTVGNARALNRDVLDLPARPTTGLNGHIDNLEFYLGLFDLNATANRSARMFTWLDQVIPVMTAYCRFIDDSRPLSSIATTGLGAATNVWLYSQDTIKVGDPFANPNTTDVAAAISSMRVRNLEASAEVRDPEMDVLATQYSVAAQVNVDLTLNGDSPTAVAMRTGPFWDMPVCDIGSDFRLEGMITASVGTIINYVSK